MVHTLSFPSVPLCSHQGSKEHEPSWQLVGWNFSASCQVCTHTPIASPLPSPVSNRSDKIAWLAAKCMLMLWQFLSGGTGAHVPSWQPDGQNCLISCQVCACVPAASSCLQWACWWHHDTAWNHDIRCGPGHQDPWVCHYPKIAFPTWNCTRYLPNTTSDRPRKWSLNTSSVHPIPILVPSSFFPISASFCPPTTCLPHHCASTQNLHGLLSCTCHYMTFPTVAGWQCTTCCYLRKATVSLVCKFQGINGLLGLGPHSRSFS